MDAPNQNNQMTNIGSVDEYLRIGDALIAHAKLTTQDVERILELQKSKNMLFGDAAIALGLIKESDLKKALSKQFNYPYLDEGSLTLSQLLVAANKPFSEEVEELRRLRSQLLISWFELGHKTLAVTSANGEDGASRLIANLAIVFSQLNKKTLLIDANLRKPIQNKLFNIETKLGLSNILANQQGSYQLTRQSSFPNLTILTAGTEVPNPQELLTQDAFGEIIKNLEDLYDIILIDTSPINLGSDALSVVSKAQGAIIVARKNKSLAQEVQYLNKQLKLTGASLIGSVIQEF